MIDLNHVHAKIEEDMTDVGKVTTPKEAKGGTFAPADVPLIKRAPVSSPPSKRSLTM